MSKTRWIIGPALLFCACLGCQGEPPAEPEVEEMVVAVPDNTICPIMGGPVKASPKTATVTWQGKTIGFCCPPCEPKWNKLTDTERAEHLAQAEAKGAAAR